MSNILFIDDDQDLLEINQKFFKKEGYKVSICNDGTNVLSLIHNNPPDCIVLDIMMPEINGFQLCKKIKSFSDIPIIMLSGCSLENDKVNGLLTGADDYMTKPFSYKELSARIQVQLRKKNPSYNSSSSILKIDIEKHIAFYKDNELNLSNQEFALLNLFLKNKNLPISYQDIGKSLWSVYSEEDRSSVMVIASRLRKKILSADPDFNAIETIRGKGYIYHSS